MVTKKIQGKRNRQAGARFEIKVRDDLIKKGWFVSKFQSNVEVIPGPLNIQPEVRKGEPYSEAMKRSYGYYQKFYNKKLEEFFVGGLIPAKASRFRLMTTGFPDFICWKPPQEDGDIIELKLKQGISIFQEIIGVEAKSNGYLDKIEKAKCEFLLKNNVFSKILVAKKIKVGRKIEVKYIDFAERYQSLKENKKWKSQKKKRQQNLLK